MSMTSDSRTWGTERAISAGKAGDRDRNVQWRPRRRFQTYAGLRFRGADAGLMTFATLEIDVEVMNA
jgi:hypothetical protein